MDKKLILNEDLFEDNNEVIENEPEIKVEETLPLSSMLNQLIKSEWDAIDLYNGVLLSISNDEEVSNVIKDIVSEEYIHVGQLEKLLQNINPAAERIESGKDEA